jgi:hypothetical protein
LRLAAESIILRDARLQQVFASHYASKTRCRLASILDLNETPSKERYPVIVEMEVPFDRNISHLTGDGSGSEESALDRSSALKPASSKIASFVLFAAIILAPWPFG